MSLNSEVTHVGIKSKVEWIDKTGDIHDSIKLSFEE